MHRFHLSHNNLQQMLRHLGLVLITVSCLSCAQQSDMNKVGEAEFCLDKATPATALECVDKVQGVDSPAADNIRCAGHFLYQGVTDTQTLSDALNELATGTTSQIQAFMNFLLFTKEATTAANATRAYEAFNYCLKGGGKAAALIASFSYLSSAMLDADNSCPWTDNPIEDSVLGIPCPKAGSSAEKIGAALARTLAQIVLSELPPPANVAIPADVTALFGTIGTIVLSTHNISCNSSKVNDELCGYMKSAIDAGGTNASAVGLEFFRVLATNNT